MKIKRIGTYITGFKYYKNDIEISDGILLEKIKKMKIPPAYDNVTIINNKKILAYGYDSKNRKQVIYNPKYIKDRADKKYDKIEDFNKYFLKIKKCIAKDIRSSGEKTKIIAMIITLILSCGFRIGNKKYEKENNSHGITTLKFSHISICGSNGSNGSNGCNIEFDFIGKKGVRNKSVCNNKYIYQYLSKKCEDLKSNSDIGDAYIFAHNDICINSVDVNNYLANKLGVNITTKDLRTWNANNLFTKFFNKLVDSKDCKNPIKRAIELTAIQLHNTPSVCKNSYIDPKIIELAQNKILHKN
jgi:DNA topoisomerase-1